MKLSTFFGILTDGRFSLMLSMRPIFYQLYRATYMATGLSEGIYAQLCSGPVSLDVLSRNYGGEEAKSRLQTWLDLGVSLGELKLTPQGYTLRSRLARQLAQPSNDAAAALLEEAAGLHHVLLSQTPARLRQNQPFQLADSDGQLIARSSRILEPFILDLVDSVIPESGGYDLLEVGCGSGVYIQRACQRNPTLRAVGLELQPDVAEFARQNLKAWGLSERVKVESADVRQYAAPQHFNLVTLHNNIYYFPEGERPALLRYLAGFLKPGGKILITTGCQGGDYTLQVLNLWAVMTQGAGAMPEPDAFCRLLEEAGYVSVRKTQLFPGQNFYAFAGEVNF